MKDSFIYWILLIAAGLALGIAGTLGMRQFGNADILCPNCNVILISLDTVRADHLGIYGYGRNTSPHIDRFFRRGIVFKNAIAQSTNTLPSHMSMMTGLYPSRHGVTLLEDPPLSSRYLTLAEILKLYGYRTEARYSGSWHLDPRFGFARGFDAYATADFRNRDARLPWEELREEKFFLFLHSGGGHDPYLPMPPYDTMFARDYHGDIIGTRDELAALLREENIDPATPEGYEKMREIYWGRVDVDDPADMKYLVAMYDGLIRQTDAALGNILEELRASGLLRNTIVILTADHGEEFYEHGGFLHRQFYDETIRVPLLFYIPGMRPMRITAQVGSIDILPTVLALVGAEIPADIDGKDLTPLLKSFFAPEPHPEIFSEFVGLSMLRTREWKLIKNMVSGKPPYELYNLTSDPGEKNNLAGQGIPEERTLRETLEAWMRFVSSRPLPAEEFFRTPFPGYSP